MGLPNNAEDLHTGITFPLDVRYRGNASARGVFSTPRVENFDEVASENGLRAGLDLVKEQRADMHLHTLSYRGAIVRLYNRRVCPQLIKLGDLVL